jgi:hypothetical protein
MMVHTLPDGQITDVPMYSRELLVKPRQKNILLYRIFGLSYIAPCPVPPKGAFRDRHRRGAGMRWTLMVSLTRALEADGEDVWSWHPDAGVKLAFSSADDGGQKARSTGESTP